MARRRKNSFSIGKLFSDLTAETIRSVWGVLFLLLGLFTVIAAIGIGGVGGDTVFRVLTNLLGVGYILLPIACFSLVFVLFRSFDEYEFGASKWVGAVLFIISGLGIIHLLFGRAGLVGMLIASPVAWLFDGFLSTIIFAAVFSISLLIMFNARPLYSFLTGISSYAHSLVGRFRDRAEDGEDVDAAVADADEPEEDEEEEEYEDEEEEYEAEDEESEERPAADSAHAQPIQRGAYTPPPLSLLEKDRGRPGTGDIKANANLIKRTLANFGIQVEIDEISIGPTVTRYAVKPAEGVRLQKIVGLANNLELALAAHPVRIEAPIPGRSLVGIEVPNTAKATVGLATLLGASAFKESAKSLYVALGKDITGQAHFADLARMPHMLIAGATGSGKSVTIHTLITSLLYRNSPQTLRFIMIDPKRVELTLYKNIPHLLTPVITDPKKAILALKWAAKEMERRYDILETESVRDIESYHTNVVAPAIKKLGKKAADEERLPEAMPYIVVVLDELADIMQAYPRELEAAIVRLAQMSRAVGIHLVLSTQRPSVNVITGLIKANVPSRVALQVSSQIDSRTILDTGGAEKLLGAGDMLYLSGDMGKPKRLQSAFISETEVKKVAKFLHDNSTYETEDALTLAGDESGGSTIGDALEHDDEDSDDLYEEAREHVLRAGKASTSYLQRRLRVGYARAARLMDMLEERGVIGPADGSKPREVLVDADGDENAEDNETS